MLRHQKRGRCWVAGAGECAAVPVQLRRGDNSQHCLPHRGLRGGAGGQRAQLQRGHRHLGRGNQTQVELTRPNCRDVSALAICFMMLSTNSHFINFDFVAVIKCTPCCLLYAINDQCTLLSVERLVDLITDGYPVYFQPWPVQQLRGVGGGHAVCDR